MPRVLFSVFGTAGDILPCIAVAKKLQNLGNEVAFATPRWLGLYSRQSGLISIALGDGSERNALSDSDMYTLRFHGLSSWRLSMCRYVLPLLESSYPQIRQQIEQYGPDLIVTTAQGYWGPLAAEELEIPCASLHLYPQLIDIALLNGGGAWARPLSRWLEKHSAHNGLLRKRNLAVEFGISEHNTALAHDPHIYNSADARITSLGFPYWDESFPVSTDLDRARQFLEETKGARIVVSLGSFLGLIEHDFWHEMSRRCREVDAHMVLVGCPPQLRDRFADFACPIGQVPISGLLDLADLMIHHGGIGSTYGALQAGVPALIYPIAFDQQFNAELVTAHHAGHILSQNHAVWPEQIRSSLADSRMASHAVELASQLIPADVAAQQIAEHLISSIPTPE